jgi:hypothetical protein
MKISRTIFTAVVAFAQFAGAIATAQQVPDPRVADLVQAGKICVGVHSVMYTKDPQTGEAKAASVGPFFTILPAQSPRGSASTSSWSGIRRFPRC